MAKKIEKLLDALDERLAKGEISEETYKRLEAKYIERLEKTTGKPALEPRPLVKKSRHPIAAGVLIIIGAGLCLALGLIYTALYIQGDNSYGAYGVHYLRQLLSGFFGYLGFGFGLIGGIYSMKRKMFPLVIIGIVFIIAEGAISFVRPVVGFLFGIPVLVFGILAAIFTAPKSEFVAPKPIRKPLVEKRGHTGAAGGLVIAGACICLALSVFNWTRLDSLGGSFGLGGFSFGLTAGILSLKRTAFPLVSIGMAFMMLAGIFFSSEGNDLTLGVLVFLLSILGLTFAALSKSDFASARLGFDKERWKTLKPEHTGLGAASLAFGLLAIIIITQLFSRVMYLGFFSPLLLPFSEILALIFGAKSYFGRSKDSFGLAGFILGLTAVIITFIIAALFAHGTFRWD